MIPIPKTIITPDQDGVISQVQIAAPPERIFQALTASALLMRWWNGEGGRCRVKIWEIEPRLGGRMRHVVEDPSTTMLPGGEGVITGKIVEFDPPRTLVYTWLADFHSQPEVVTLVRWELVPDQGGTLVKMTHSGLKPLTEGVSYAQGWPGVIHGLKSFAEADRGDGMTTTFVTSDLDAVVSEIDIAAPPERVFAALTEAEQLLRWFTDASCPVKFWRMDARKGGSYSYATEKGNFEINGVSEFACHGEILEIDRPRLLVYSWVANWHADKQRKTIVRWELTPTVTGTHVKVTHSGLGQEQVARDDYRGGWPGVVEKLKQFTEQ
jgi:uncharacterized protein YndB with AHSA1/START domain